MATIYAIEVKARDLPLITMLNDGVAPKVEKKRTWFVFEIDDKGDSINTKIVTHRELISDHDVLSHSPLVLRLKNVK